MMKHWQVPKCKGYHQLDWDKLETGDIIHFDHDYTDEGRLITDCCFVGLYLGSGPIDKFDEALAYLRPGRLPHPSPNKRTNVVFALFFGEAEPKFWRINDNDQMAGIHVPPSSHLWRPWPPRP